MLLPGPQAQQLATYIGWLMHRSWGGIVAGVLFVLPSLGILIALSWAYVALGYLPLVAGLFDGIKPAVIAIVAHAAYRIGSRTLKNPLLWAIAIASFQAPYATSPDSTFCEFRPSASAASAENFKPHPASPIRSSCCVAA